MKFQVLLLGVQVWESYDLRPNLSTYISWCFADWFSTLIFRAVNGSEQWPLLRYFYQYFLARTAKQIVNRHRDILLSDEIIARYNLDVNAIFSAKSLVTFDELYTRYLFYCYFYGTIFPPVL